MCLDVFAASFRSTSLDDRNRDSAVQEGGARYEQALPGEVNVESSWSTAAPVPG
jgi:hypothetical protein